MAIDSLCSNSNKEQRKGLSWIFHFTFARIYIGQHSSKKMNLSKNIQKIFNIFIKFNLVN